MSSKTKIVVLKSRELIYTTIFLALAIFLIVLLVMMFCPTEETPSTETSLYIPGVYTSSLTLNNQALDISVSVDEDHINQIRFVQLTEEITAMYPLMESAMDSIANQIVLTQSLDNISYTDDMKYTATLLLETIEQILQKARVK
ncbi:MAG: hypothetical protein ACI4C1_05860 [Lachnospiraceae bacterium]